MLWRLPSKANLQRQQEQNIKTQILLDCHQSIKALMFCGELSLVHESKFYTFLTSGASCWIKIAHLQTLYTQNDYLSIYATYSGLESIIGSGVTRWDQGGLAKSLKVHHQNTSI